MRISDWSSDVCSSDLESLVDAIEAALGTPVQTAVKREDEQAFARLNDENLMFCEDAARRVAAALSADDRLDRFNATLSHLTRLPPHISLARVRGGGGEEASDRIAVSRGSHPHAPTNPAKPTGEG